MKRIIETVKSKIETLKSIGHYLYSKYIELPDWAARGLIAFVAATLIILIFAGLCK